MAAIVAYVPDLMDRSKVAAALPGAEFVTEPELLIDHPAPVVLLDLGRPRVLEVLPLLEGRLTVGFASHVDVDLIESATAAGCVEVLPRSSFFKDLSRLA